MLPSPFFYYAFQEGFKCLGLDLAGVVVEDVIAATRAHLLGFFGVGLEVGIA